MNIKPFPIPEEWNKLSLSWIPVEDLYSIELLWAFALGRGDHTAAYALYRLSRGQPITPAEKDSLTAIRNELEEATRKYNGDE